MLENSFLWIHKFMCGSIFYEIDVKSCNKELQFKYKMSKCNDTYNSKHGPIYLSNKYYLGGVN